MTDHRNASTRTGFPLALLWVALAIGMIGNFWFSVSGKIGGNIAFSVLTLFAIIGLVVHGVRRRNR